ncbi:MAG: hypothetical protein ACREFN_15775 [Acetobacteraceae bacterium]
MSETAAVLPPVRQRLEYLPIGLLASVVGLAGLSVAWRIADERYAVRGELAAPEQYHPDWNRQMPVRVILLEKTNMERVQSA